MLEVEPAAAELSRDSATKEGDETKRLVAINDARRLVPTGPRLDLGSSVMGLRHSQLQARYDRGAINDYHSNANNR